MTRSLVNHLYQQALYSFKMNQDKCIQERLDMFNKWILDLESIGVIIDNEDQALLFLCSLPKTHAHYKETLLFGRASLFLDEVHAASNSN